MTRPRVLLSLCVGSLLWSACGVKAGDDCQGSVYTCSSEKEALECKDSKWRALPCQGASGCSEQDGSVSCDLRGNAAGDGCALVAEGHGLCSADGKALLECRMGMLVQVRTCGSCTQSTTLVTCNP